MFAWENGNPQKLAVPDMPTGRTWVEEILSEINSVMEQMRKAEGREQMQKLQDRHWELIQYKRSVQNFMTKLVQLKMKARK